MRLRPPFERILSYLHILLKMAAVDERGAFAIMAAVVMPAMIILSGVLFESGLLATQYTLAKRLSATACLRAVKPTRTTTPTDEVRRKHILAEFDASTTGRLFTVKSRNATIDWLDVDLDADVSYKTIFASIVGVSEINFSLHSHCAGIPPYPKDGDTILDSNFVKPDGSEIPLRFTYICNNVWDVYSYKQFGWDEGTGPGVEIQDWSDPSCFGKLPGGNYPSKYVVELDSDANSSITKIMEMHAGIYEISLWYNGRSLDAETNTIAIYLQQLRPTAGDKRALFKLADSNGSGWKYYTTRVSIDRYSIYKLTIAAEGQSDTFGGLMNAFHVTYVNTNDGH